MWNVKEGGNCLRLNTRKNTRKTCIKFASMDFSLCWFTWLFDFVNSFAITSKYNCLRNCRLINYTNSSKWYNLIPKIYSWSSLDPHTPSPPINQTLNPPSSYGLDFSQKSVSVHVHGSVFMRVQFGVKFTEIKIVESMWWIRPSDCLIWEFFNILSFFIIFFLVSTTVIRILCQTFCAAYSNKWNVAWCTAIYSSGQLFNLYKSSTTGKCQVCGPK